MRCLEGNPQHCGLPLGSAGRRLRWNVRGRGGGTPARRCDLVMDCGDPPQSPARPEGDSPGATAAELPSHPGEFRAGGGGEKRGVPAST